MAQSTAQADTVGAVLFSAQQLAQARGRLADRGIDPESVLGQSELGGEITVAGFYLMLERIAATEKAGQSPTFAMARLAALSGLPSELADSLFLAYNQQSAEEAGHGDKVFGNAFYAMGGFAPASTQSAVGNGAGAAFPPPSDDKKQNKKRLGGMAAFLGGIETVALSRVFPLVGSLCERWGHPIGQDLLLQIRDVVRPEESRHVLIWRYVFHHLIAPKGEAVVDMYLQATNAGRRQLAAPELDREALSRLLGSSAPSTRQLLGKERVVFA